MPRVSGPQTDAEWRAFDRGEWPPKKAVAKKPVKRVVKRAPVKQTRQVVEPVKPVKQVVVRQPVVPVSKPVAAKVLLDEIDVDEVDDEDDFEDFDDELLTVEDLPSSDDLPTKSDMLLGCETPRIFTPPKRELTEDTTDGFAAIRFAQEILGMNLFPWQKWLLIHALELNPDYTYRFRTVIMEAARQNGKALDVATPILTTDGWSTMGDLKIGDDVFHPDGHPTRVIGAFDVMQNHDCYEVTTTDGRRIVADSEHLWTVKDMRRSKHVGGAYGTGGNLNRVGNKRGVRTHAWETLTTRELLDRGLYKTHRDGVATRECAFRMPQQHKVVSKPVELPIDPYVFGLWLGDGYSNEAALAVGDQDFDVIRANLTACGMRIVSEKRGRTAWKLGFNIAGAKSRDGFQARAMRLGVAGNKHVPVMYLTAGTEQRQALLAGMLDSDGYCHKQGQVGFTSTKERLADAVLYLARSLGYRAAKREDRATLYGRDCGANYSVMFTPREHVFRLVRKNDRIKVGQPLGGRAVVSIKSIEQVSSRPVRCIKVDRDDGLFLAGEGLMPTHNTTIMIILALWHLYCKGSRTIIATAQDLSKAEDAWSAAVEMAQEDEELNELIRKISLAHPKLFQVVNPITNKKCSYRVAAKARGAGRGFSGDLVLLDELREHHTFDSWGAVTKTQMARPRAQAWAFTNAGDAMSVVWRYQRALAHRDLGWPDGDADADVLGTLDPAVTELFAQLEKEFGQDFGTGWFEWSAPPNAPRTDRNAWAQANGSMNHTEVVEDCVTERAIAHALHTDPVAVFDQEVMCRYVPFADGGPFPDGKWRDTKDDEAMPAKDAKSMLCVEVSTTRSASVIVKAAKDDDGKAVVGVDEMKPGTDWVLPYLLEQRSSFAGVVVRAGAGSPVLSLLQDFLDAGLPVTEWKGGEIGAAFGQLFDKVKDEHIRHLSHPTLDAAACSALIKTQTAGGWIVDPVNSPSDVAPLYGVAGAVWGLAYLPDTGPSIYAGPQGVKVLTF